MHFDGNFAAPPLRLQDARQSDELSQIQSGHGFARINTDSKHPQNYFVQITCFFDFPKSV